jgi:hypothetical protein
MFGSWDVVCTLSNDAASTEDAVWLALLIRICTSMMRLLTCFLLLRVKRWFQSSTRNDAEYMVDVVWKVCFSVSIAVFTVNTVKSYKLLQMFRKNIMLPRSGWKTFKTKKTTTDIFAADRTSNLMQYFTTYEKRITRFWIKFTLSSTFLSHIS